jgi:hypothetical protein
MSPAAPPPRMMTSKSCFTPLQHLLDVSGCQTPELIRSKKISIFAAIA